MTVPVFSLVLLAAALHAIWNAVIKGTGDRTIAIGLVALGHMVLGLIGAAILPLPDIKVIPFIIASTLIHWGYYYSLTTAYKFGDLSLIYPIARGISPIIVTFFAFFWIVIHTLFDIWGLFVQADHDGTGITIEPHL